MNLEQPQERWNYWNVWNDLNDWNGPRLFQVLGKTKANVVAVVGVVPVPVRRTQVPRFVVPGTAADHPLIASWPVPLLKTAWEKDCGSSPN